MPDATPTNGTPRIGFYVCHCGTNIAGTVDVKAVADYVATLQRRRRLARVQVHVLRSGAGADPAGHPGTEAQPDRGGLLLSPAARAHLPPRHGTGRAEPVLLPDGQHPRERLLGAHRSGCRDTEGQGPHPGCDPARLFPQGSGAEEGPHQRRRARGRRRDRRHPRGADLGQRRQAGLSRRARTDHRRPHGHVRQDLPDARLRRLHPDPQDVGGQIPPQHHPLDLLRGGKRRRLRRQLQGQGETQAPLHQRGPLRRLHGVRRRPASTRTPASPTSSTWA